MTRGVGKLVETWKLVPFSTLAYSGCEEEPAETDKGGG